MSRVRMDTRGNSTHAKTKLNLAAVSWREKG